jgi:hypothetical protein
MNERRLVVPEFGGLVLAVCLVSAPLEALLLPQTAQKRSPVRTSTLPGDKAPRLESIGEPPEGVVVSELVVAELLKELDRSAPLPQRFPSGIGRLELRVALTYSTSPPDSLEYPIENRSGAVKVSGYQSVMRKTGELTVRQDLEAASGVFPDGPYRLTLVIDGKAVARLNWMVGGTPAMKPAAGPAAAASPPEGSTRAHSNRVVQLAITPDGKALFSAAWDGTVKVWSLAGRRYVKTLAGHDGNVYALAVCPDGRTLAGGGHNDTVKLWSLPGGDPAGTLEREDGSMKALVASPDGRLLAAGYFTSTIKLWSLPERQLLKALGASAGVNALAVSPDGKTLIAGSFGPIERWSLPDGAPLGALPNPKSSVNALAVSPDGRMLASASENAPIVQLRSLPEGDLIGTLEGHKEGIHALAITADGTRLISGSGDNSIGVWSLSDRKLEAFLEGHRADVLSLAVTPDGKTLVAGDESGVINLWDLAAHTLVGSLR